MLYTVSLILVHKVFEDVAKSYDLMNDAMSLGIHRLWKDVFIERLYPTPGTRLLDVAGGTGDIAFRYIEYLRKQPDALDKKSMVTILDINQNMLDVGEERAQRYRKVVLVTCKTLNKCILDSSMYLTRK